MQTIRELEFSLRKASPRLWIYFLLFYSGTITVFLILGTSTSPLLIFPFLIFVPGYALVAIVFPKSLKPEKVMMSIGFSVALSAGIKSIMITYSITGLFSELVVLAILSSVLLMVKLIKTES